MPTNPVHTTGTAAGMAAAIIVLCNAASAYWFHIVIGDAVAAAEIALLTYGLGAWLHLPSN